MQPPLERFHVLSFEDEVAARIFVVAVKHYLQTLASAHLRAGPRRAEIWRGAPGAQPADTARACLFVSAGALEAAAGVGLGAHPVAELTPPELPTDRILLVGAAPSATEGTSSAPDARRHFRDSFGTPWTAAEVIAPDSALPPRQRRTPCLVFETACVTRRVWRYPRHWRSLSDPELEALNWKD